MLKQVLGKSVKDYKTLLEAVDAYSIEECNITPKIGQYVIRSAIILKKDTLVVFEELSQMLLWINLQTNSIFYQYKLPLIDLSTLSIQNLKDSEYLLYYGLPQQQKWFIYHCRLHTNNVKIRLLHTMIDVQKLASYKNYMISFNNDQIIYCYQVVKCLKLIKIIAINGQQVMLDNLITFDGQIFLQENNILRKIDRFSGKQLTIESPEGKILTISKEYVIYYDHGVLVFIDFGNLERKIVISHEQGLIGFYQLQQKEFLLLQQESYSTIKILKMVVGDNSRQYLEKFTKQASTNASSSVKVAGGVLLNCFCKKNRQLIFIDPQDTFKIYKIAVL